MYPTRPEWRRRVPSVRSGSSLSARRAAGFVAAVVMLLSILAASAAPCFAAPPVRPCCCEGADSSPLPCESLAAAVCCAPSSAPLGQSLASPAPTSVGMSLALPSFPLAFLPPQRDRMARGPAPMPRALLLLRVSVLRL